MLNGKLERKNMGSFRARERGAIYGCGCLGRTAVFLTPAWESIFRRGPREWPRDKDRVIQVTVLEQRK